MSNLGAAIVSGGRSSRMGRDKAFVRLLGRPMIEHVVARMQALPASSLIVIANRVDDYAHLGLPVFPDVMRDKGALGGIFSALTHSPSEYTLVVACDMPFINVTLLRHMATLLDERDGPYDVIVPVHSGHPQGLHAIYRKTCLAPILTDLETDRLKVIGFYGSVQVRYVEPAEYHDLDPDGLSFRNVNTPVELEIANKRDLQTGDRLPHEDR